jgi:hypothetical protein
MLEEIEIDFSSGTPQRATPTVETMVSPMRKWKRPDLGRVALSAAAATLVFDTYAMAQHVTQMAEPLTCVPEASRAFDGRSQEVSEIERFADQRARLFALQDAGNKTVELQARLDMLTSKLQQLDARVSEEGLTVLERMMNGVQKRQENLRRFEQQFGF